MRLTRLFESLPELSAAVASDEHEARRVPSCDACSARLAVVPADLYETPAADDIRAPAAAQCALSRFRHKEQRLAYLTQNLGIVVQEPSGSQEHALEPVPFLSRELVVGVGSAVDDACAMSAKSPCSLKSTWPSTAAKRPNACITGASW
jgi:hypothetical protein